jgi:tetratricopeptide (TPR) repeat protein
MRALSLVVAVAALVCAAAVLADEQPGAGIEKLGTVHFQTSCSPPAQKEFERALALLHSFWFRAAIPAFKAVDAADPGCAIAQWGIAMALLGNPLAVPPAPQALKDGWAAIEKARAIGAKTQRERDYVDAIGQFYTDADKVDHRTRTLAYEKAMADLSSRYGDDREAAVFYALALDITALPTDKTYANQLKAAAILEKVFAVEPNHPGVSHYLIHSYDYPPIAAKGLPAARRYAGIAPSAPHALHMPSHIFTRVGAWQDSVDSNRASAEVARKQSSPGEMLHALDYQIYAYLQMAQDKEARRVLGELGAVVGTDGLDSARNANAFALAAIPARYVLERRAWAEAAALEPQPSRFPYTEAMTHFARAVGLARSGDAPAARKAVEKIAPLYDALVQAKNAYWAEQVDIQQRVALAFVRRAEGRSDEALALLRGAADLEDATEKSPVTPGPLAPARELLGEMLLEANQPAQALKEFEASARREPNRLHGLYGAARAAELSGDRQRARNYYGRIVVLTSKADSERIETKAARTFLSAK